MKVTLFMRVILHSLSQLHASSRMAHFPRKSSSSRKPSPDSSADDLFGAAPPEPEAEAESPVENWTLEDGPVTPGKGTTLPPAVALPATIAASPRPSAVPEKRNFESNPQAAAPPIPEAIPLTAPAPRTTPATPAPRPPAEVYDPFKINEDLPDVASHPAQATPTPAPAVVPDITKESLAKPEPAYFDGEEPPADDPTDQPLSDGLPQGVLRPGGLIAAALVLIVLLGGFIGLLYLNRPDSELRDARSEPTVPLAGNIVTLSAIQSGWRTRQPGDLVSTVDVTLPTPSRQTSALLPMVRFTLDATATKTGFLRFIFLDPDGKISGDVRVVKVSGGTLERLSSGASVTNPGTATVYGSLGFMDRPGFVAYATGDSARWSVEVSESADYNAKQEGWTKLETFDLSNSSDP